MRRDEVLRILDSCRQELSAFQIRSLALFGSVARDEAGPDSDVDFLVDFEGPPTFARFMDLKFFLEEALGQSVDLVTRRSLRDELRQSAELDGVLVYAA